MKEVCAVLQLHNCKSDTIAQRRWTDSVKSREGAVQEMRGLTVAVQTAAPLARTEIREEFEPT